MALAWKIYFWLVAALLLLPLPFKIFEYITGRDGSPRIVKIEEMTNAAFFAVGLVGLYGYVYKQQFLAPSFWKIWVVLAVVISITALFWSPKLTYAVATMGQSNVRLVLAAGSLFLLPMLVGIWRYAAAA